MSMYIIPTASVSDILYSTRAIGSSNNQLAGLIGVGQLNLSIPRISLYATRSGFLATIRTTLSGPTGLYLMKGIVPTTTQFKAGSPNSEVEAESPPFRSVDTLVKLNAQITNPSLSWDNMVLNLTPSVSISSGPATWFVLHISPPGGTPWGRSYPDSNPVYSIMGTVSDLSGDGDLKLNTTSIASNQSVDLKRLQIPLPTEFRW